MPFPRVQINKIFIEQNSPEPKVKILIPMYEPLEVSKCEECGKVKLNLEKKIEYSKANSQSIDPDYEDYGF